MIPGRRCNHPGEGGRGPFKKVGQVWNLPVSPADNGMIDQFLPTQRVLLVPVDGTRQACFNQQELVSRRASSALLYCPPKTPSRLAGQRVFRKRASQPRRATWSFSWKFYWGPWNARGVLVKWTVRSCSAATQVARGQAADPARAVTRQETPSQEPW